MSGAQGLSRSDERSGEESTRGATKPSLMDQIQQLESSRHNNSHSSDRPKNTPGSSVKLRKWPPGAQDEEVVQPPKDTSPAGIFGVKLKSTGKLTPEPASKFNNTPKRGIGGKIMEFVRRTEAAAAGGSPLQAQDDT